MSVAVVSTLQADEGMWLFKHPPRQVLKETYGFEPNADWLRHVQQSAVRFNSGGSGSFVSPGRPGDDQPSRRGGLPAKAEHARAAT